MADGPAAGLGLVEQVEQSGTLSIYHLLSATRADLLRRLGRSDEAALAYRRALALAPTDAERRYLSKRLAETSVARERTGRRPAAPLAHRLPQVIRGHPTKRK